MARFNSILSEGQGTLGNYYLRKAKAKSGKTINVLATKNFSPTNPRTTAQQNQRAKFATAVKFYKRATANFFKFAYEDKRSNESYFNAFMRHNVSGALGMVKAQSENYQWPALGSWMLSYGSLDSVPVTAAGDNFQVLGVEGAKTLSTIGQLSELFLNAGYQKGDIVTFVRIVVPAYSSAELSLTDKSAIASVGQAKGSPKWAISQFYIDADSSTAIAEVAYRGGNVLFDGSNVLLSCVADDGSDAAHLVYTVPSSLTSMGVGLAVIVTRKQDSSLLASTQYLASNANLRQMLLDVAAADYQQLVSDSWQASEEAILAGDVAENGSYSAAAGTVTTANGDAIPVSLADQPDTENVSLALVGTDLDKVKLSDFHGERIAFVSYSTTSATAATLIVKGDKTSADASTVYCGSQLIATITWTDISVGS